MRVPLVVRVSLWLCAASALATAMGLVFQANVLSTDLERAGRERLEKAVASAAELARNHERATAERYAAISGSPLFRANLEVRDARTLEHFATELLARQGAARVLFLDTDDSALAGAGDPALDGALLAVSGASLIAHQGRAYVAVQQPLATGARPVGTLRVAEPIDAATLLMWSRLCGADVLIGAGPSDAEHISAPVRSLGALEMRASLSLRAEREAALHARSNLLEAGVLVLGLVMLASYLLARRTMAPILALQRAVLAVGEGDFSVRVDDSRSDEIGDLARGVNRMAAQLGVHEAERAAANIELVRAKTAAEVASRTKSQFLANVSHELRTPLTAILGYADLLLEQPEVKAQAASYEAMRGVQRSGDHLLALIDDFLDLSQVEAGKLQLHEVPCCVRDLFSELADLLRSRAREKGLGFTVSVAPEVPEVLVLDPTRVRQILLNLTSNALKFTERGGVNVLCELQDASLLRISVSDSGIGMTAEQLARVYEPFYQADSSPTRVFGGTGLGLTVSRRLIEVLGGTLQVESEFGRGSTFCVRLPAARGASPHPTLLARASAAEEQRAEPALPRGLRVLLAEDGPDNQKVLGFMLKKLGVDARTVQNGQLALEAALEAEALGDPFRVVLMDMQMPVLDGYAATAELRARGYTGPIVALTAHAMRGDRERCLAAGCDDYLTKPTTRGRLATAIARALGKLEKPGDA